MKKRITAVLLGMALLASVFTGCGNQNDAQEGASSGGNSGGQEETGSSTDEGTDDTPDAGAAADGELVEIVWLWPGDAPEGLQEMEDALNAMMESDIGVHVTLYPCADWANQVTLDVSTGTQVDICLTVGGGVGGKVKDGIIQPMDDIIEQYGPDIIEDCGDSIKGGYYNGLLYGVPNAWLLGDGYGFYANADLLEEYGYGPGEPGKSYSLEELEEMMVTVKAGEGDSFYPASINGLKDLTMRSFFEFDLLSGGSPSTGVLILRDGFDNTTIENLYETEAYEEYARRMYDWAQKGYISKDAATDTSSALDHIPAGDGLGIFYWLDEQNSTYDETMSAIQVNTYTYNMIPKYITSDVLGNILWSIPVTSVNPRKALEALNYIYKHDEAAWLLQFGIEGRDYEVIEETEIDGKKLRRIKYLSDNPSALPYYQGMGVYGDRFSWPVVGETLDIDYNQKCRESDAGIPDSRRSSAMGYVFVKDSVSSEIAAVDAVREQYEKSVAYGTVDPDVILPEFRQALKDAGIDKIIEENQRQFDEWLSTQN